MKAKFLVFSWLCVFSAVGAGALTVYSLDVGVFENEAEALARQQELSRRLAPVFVEETPSGWQVRVGHFLSEVEAWVFKVRLGREQLPGCRICAWPWDGRPLEGKDYLPVEWPFDRMLLGETPRETECLLDYETRGEPPLEALEALAATSTEELTPQQLYDRGDWAADHDLAIDSLEQLLRDAPGSALANPARLLLARRHMRKRELERAQACLETAALEGTQEEKSKAALLSAYVILYSASHSAEQTYEAFRRVANDPEVSPEDRLDAMLRVGAKAHQLQWLPSAWLAYSQMEEAFESPKVIGFARVQKAALAFEWVSRGVGSWDETRRLCEAVMDMEAVPLELRATAELMWLETFFQERDYALCMQSAQQFVQTYSSVKRECGMALLWIAITQALLGRKAEALETIEEIQRLDFEYPEYSFAGRNVKASAAHWAVWLTQDNPAERDRWVELLSTKYPDSHHTKWVLSRYVGSSAKEE